MKVIKAKIKIDRSGGGTQYTYPPEWDAPRIPFIVYPQERGTVDEVTDANGQMYQYVLATVPDDLYDTMIKNTEVFQAVTLAEAKIMGERHRPQFNKVTDMAAIANVLIKIGKAEPLSLEDQKALDPNDPTPGIHKSKCCEDWWKEFEVKW